jgi:putative oxidoreductase
MKKINSYLVKLAKPVVLKLWYMNLLIAIPRVVGGLMLCFEFGSSKFGMPWSTTEDLGLFQVAGWFPEDVSKFGIPFVWAPALFAWLGAATEAIGGLFLAVGFGTRIWGALLTVTMLTAIFFQKWPDAIEYGSSWPLLPAIGFLWIALYSIALGSGKFGLDYLLTKKTD